MTEETSDPLSGLSRREVQIMEILYASGPLTVAEVTEQMPDPLSRNAVRTFLSILVGKGKLTRTKKGREFIFAPRSEKKAVAHSAFQKMLDVFFNGSLSDAVAASFSGSKSKIDDEELRRLEQLIAEVRDSKSKKK